MPVSRILLIDDDVNLAAILAGQLAETGAFEAILVHTAASALEKAREERFEAILLDIGLPDLDGRELCRLLRRERVHVPILIVSAASSDADTILSLNSGADDFVSKPFSFPLLAARIRAQLRKVEMSDAAVFPVGSLTFKTGARLLVSSDGRRKVTLTRIEAEILKRLCRTRGRLVAGNELLQAIWGDEEPARWHSLHSHLYRLRKKIEELTSHDGILITEARGYRLLDLSEK